jgi:hypothetical protein
LKECAVIHFDHAVPPSLFISYEQEKRASGDSRCLTDKLLENFEQLPPTISNDGGE